MALIEQNVTRYLVFIGVIYTALLLLAGCENNKASSSPADDGRWQIQLSGGVNTAFDVDTYIIDLFDSSDALIKQLQQQGIEVICYFSAGSFENWREDVDQFTEADIGKELEGWEGEKWLDIRSSAVRLVTQSRLDLAVKKGCDGVDPDNVNSYANDTGFDITREDQIDFNLYVANESHQRGLLVGLKNTLGLVPDLHDSFDFAVNEQCFEYQECALLQPFVDAAKPVFSIEYADDMAAAELKMEQNSICVQSKGLGLHTLLMPLMLDGSFRAVCL